MTVEGGGRARDRGAGRELGLPLGLAFNQMAFAALCGDVDERARTAGSEARDALERLGAVALIARLDELLGAQPSVATPEPVTDQQRSAGAVTAS